MSTTARESTTQKCSSFLLLSYRRGHLADDDARAVESHLAECQSCRADYESIEFVSVKLSIANSALAALDGFDPDPQHAQMCYALSDRRLAQIRQESYPPKDAEAQAHLDCCPYCRLRLQLAGSSTGRLMDQMETSLTQEPLAAARRKVLAQVIWQEEPSGASQLLERVGEALHAAGQGLASCLLGPRLVPAMAQGALLGSEAGAQAAPAEVQTWEIPVDAPAYTIRLALRPSEENPEDWELYVALSAETELPALADARLELRDGEGRPYRSGPLSDYEQAPFSVTRGEWRLSVKVGDDVRVVPVTVGAPPRS